MTSQVKPAGAAERITKDDIETYLYLAKAIPPDASAPGEGEWLALSRAQLLTGQRMTESVHKRAAVRPYDQRRYDPCAGATNGGITQHRG